MKTKSISSYWQAQVNGNRIGVMAALKAIEAGSIDELELEKMHNFCLFALSLMELEGDKKWARAKLNAKLNFSDKE